MSKEFINIKKIEKDWENSEFRKKANDNWSKIKNKVEKYDKDNHSKIKIVLNILKYIFLIFGIIYFLTSLILFDQKYEDAYILLSLSIVLILFGYICYSKVNLKDPKQFYLERNNEAQLSGAYDRMINNKDDFIEIQLGNLTLDEYKKKYQYQPNYEIEPSWLSLWLGFDVKHFGTCFMIGAFVPPLALYMLIMMQSSLRIDGNLGILFAWILYYVGFIQPGDPCFYPSGLRTGSC